jgi:hypothetical protein
MASAPQRIATAVIVTLLVVVAFAVGRPRASAGHPGAPGAPPGRLRPAGLLRAPAPWQAGTAVFVTSAVFVARPENWWGIPVGIVLLAAAAAVIIRWSRDRHWGAEHRLASAGGALLTYSCLGFLLLMLHGIATVTNLVAQGFLVLGTLALFLTARRTVRRASGAVAGGTAVAP